MYTLGSTVSPEQRFDLTFGAANDGLSAISSTPGTGTPFSTTIPLTIVAGGSGVEGSGGFSYNACSNQGTVHYWGLTDSQGRLALPYFRTKAASTTVCGNPAGSYVDYNPTGTLVNGWPKDQVPFLVEIDHEDNCTSCSTTQMSTGNLVLTVSSLPTKFLHNLTSETNGLGGIYGWNHCKYPGISMTPTWNSSTDAWDEDICEPGDGLALIQGVAYTGETCECCNDSFSMVPRVLEGTNTPIGYVTYDSGSPINSYLPFGNCGTSADNRNSSVVRDILKNHKVYMKASLSCESNLYGSPWYDTSYGSNGLGNIYGCNGGCATSFPAPNSAANLELDFYFVSTLYEDVFKKLDDKTIYNNSDFLKNGLSIQSISAGVLKGSPITFPTNFSCGSESGSVTGVIANNCEVESTSPTDKDTAFELCHCINGNKNTIEVGLNLTGCLGSRIVIYACSSWNKGVYNKWHTNANAQFGDLCSFAVRTIAEDIGGCFAPVTGDTPNDCFSNYRQEWQDAFTANASGDTSVERDLIYSCYNPDPQACCLDISPTTNQPHKARELFRYATDTTERRGCWCDGFDNMDVAMDVTWQTLTNPVTSGQTTGWYGTPKYPTGPGDNCDNNIVFYYWSGENISGHGNIGPLPLDDPIAIHYQDSDLSTEYTDPNSHASAVNSISVEPACNFHTGPNRDAFLGAQTTEPYRSTTLLDGPPNLQPETCTPTPGAAVPIYGNCGTPYPFDTYAGGIGVGITVNKKACWPEVMTVHKIDCVSSGYNLHVSREYFEHDRNWYAYVADQVLVARHGLIEGGMNSNRYSCEETYLDCVDPGTGVSPTTLDYYFAVKMMTPSDSVSPVYPNLCATGTEPFFLTDQSAIGGYNTSSTCGGDLVFPSISGQQFWNYYNLLYDIGDPSALMLTDAGIGYYQVPPDPEADCNESYPHNLASVGTSGDPVFTSEGQIRSAHSCIQDLESCGGDLWCNKEFFPRRSYAVNTRITKFGALSMCTQNAQLQNPSWYEGHEVTWGDSPNKQELVDGTFIDACDDDAVVLLGSQMEINENILFIPSNNSTGSVNSILTLMGQIHPGFKSNVNEKTCIYASSGECLTFLPEHSDRSIRDITFTPDVYGYYLDKLVASGTDDCLFTPFKIMMDVECCADRIGHRGTSDPTNLNYIAKIPSSVCEGWISESPCTCSISSDNSCDESEGGPWLTTCIIGVQATEVTLVGSCATGCSDPLSGVVPLWFQDPFISSIDYLIEGTNNDPESLFTIHQADALITTSEIPCQDECIGSGGSGIGLYDSNSFIETVYEYNGAYYINLIVRKMDGHFYNGNYWRFSGNNFNAPGNCCTDDSGDDYTVGLLTNGCDCSWNTCDVVNSNLVPTGAIWIDIDQFEGYGSGINEVEYMSGCELFPSYRSCPYPSIVHFNITEDI